MEKILEKTAGYLQQLRPRLWTLNFILICLSTLTIFLTFHGLNPILPLYIEKFGGTKLAGLAMASLTLAAIMARPVAGWAVDKYGRKAILSGGILLLLLPMVIYIQMVPVILLIALRFIQGLGWGISHTAAGTVAADIIPRERIGEGMGFYSLNTSISMAVAPALALWLIEHYSFRELFMACSLLVILSLSLAQFIRYPKIEKLSADSKFVLMEKSALRPAVVIFLVGFTYSAIISFLPLYAEQQGLASAGLFFTVLAFAALICRPFAGIMIDRKGKKGYDFVVVIGSFAVIAAMPVLARLFSLQYLIAGAVLYGIGFGFMQPSMLALSISSVTPEKKGSAYATFGTGADAGIAFGSIVWGLIANTLGYRMLFSLNIVPALLAFLVYFTWRRGYISGC